MTEQLEIHQELQIEARKQMATYLGAAFGFVAGLAWNDAISSLIDLIFPLDKNSIWVKFIYAIVITVLVVIVSIYLFKPLKKHKKPKEVELTKE